jgi:hypothetical protein
MKTLLRVIPSTLALLMALGASADVLTMRDGRAIEGTYRGGNEQVIQFEVDGKMQTVRVTDLMALTFTARAASAAPATKTPAAAGDQAAPAAKPTAAPPSTATAASAPEAATPAAPAVRTLTVPAGTRLRVRMADTLDPRKNTAEDRFAAVLDAPLAVEDVTIAPASSRVYGIVAEANAAGPAGSRLKLELTELMIQGQTLKIVTGTHQAIESTEEAPAKAAEAESAGIHADRIQGGAILEFRLLQPFEIRTR